MQQTSFWSQRTLLAVVAFSLATSALCLRAQNPAPAPTPAPAPEPVVVPGPMSDASAYVKFGVANGAKGDVDGAIQAFDQAIKIDPKFAPAYFNRGIAHGLQGKPDDAIADYDQAIQLNPNYKEAYYQRGSLKGQEARFDDAAKDFSTVIKLDPKYAPAYYNRGHVQYFQGNLDEAGNEINQALSLNPNFSYSYFIRGLIRHAQGEKAKALSDFRDSAGLGFPYASLWIWISQMEDNQKDQAQSDLTGTLSNSNMFKAKSSAWAAQLANLLLGKLKPDQLLAQANTSGPGGDTTHTCEAWFYIGITKRLAGDNAGAKDAFTKAVATNSKGSEEFIEANRELSTLP